MLQMMARPMKSPPLMDLIFKATLKIYHLPSLNVCEFLAFFPLSNEALYCIAQVVFCFCHRPAAILLQLMPDAYMALTTKMKKNWFVYLSSELNWIVFALASRIQWTKSMEDDTWDAEPQNTCKYVICTCISGVSVSPGVCVFVHMCVWVSVSLRCNQIPRPNVETIVCTTESLRILDFHSTSAALRFFYSHRIFFAFVLNGYWTHLKRSHKTNKICCAAADSRESAKKNYLLWIKKNLTIISMVSKWFAYRACTECSIFCVLWPLAVQMKR